MKCKTPRTSASFSQAKRPRAKPPRAKRAPLADRPKVVRPAKGGERDRSARPDAALGAFDVGAVGHNPSRALPPQDEALFRAFQSNLLSLISHELRTPLTGILNSLSLLEDADESTEFSAHELITMARRNAARLQQSLASLLDVAALESGVFHARLKEVDLARLVKIRVEAKTPVFRDFGLEVDVQTSGEKARSPQGSQAALTLGEDLAPLLADPQKLGRAIDLCLDVAISRAQAESKIQIRISPARVEVRFKLKEGSDELWRAAWSQAVAGFQGGVASPASAFAGAMQSEQAFLTRMEEGLGSEFLLIFEIARLHQGKFRANFDERLSRRDIELVLELPEMTSEAGLHSVLSSRAYQASMELGTVALGLVEVPAGKPVEAFRMQVKKSLFRATDAVYSLPAKKQLALVMDDCKPEDAPRLLARIEKALGVKLRYGVAACPSDGTDPTHLMELAVRRLAASGT